MMTFSTRLKKLRKEKGLNQEQLADKLNKSKSSISSYESGRRTPDIVALQEIAGFFNVSVDYLLGNSDIRHSPNEKIKQAIEDDPELYHFWDKLSNRDDLKLLFKQTQDLPADAIEDVIRIIKRIEDSKN